MSKNLKKFNLFIFISSFARSMIELFIPLYLFKAGFLFEQILFYYIFVFLFSIIVSTLLTKIGNKTSHKFLIIITSFSFIITYFLMNNLCLTTSFLILLALFYSIYRRSYWIVKRYYAIDTTDKKNSGITSAWITISAQAAGLFASLLGGLFLDKEEFLILSFISLSLMLLSIIPLLLMKTTKEEEVTILSLKEIIKTMPKQNFAIYFLSESLFLLNLFFPLYIYTNVSESYGFVGIFNLLLGLSSILFVFMFAKKMDRDKNDHLKFITLALGILFLFKLNVDIKIIILIIAVIEGYLSKIYEVSLSRDIWYYGKKFNKSSYNYLMELSVNISRLLMVLIIFLFGMDLIGTIYFLIALFIIMFFFKFNDGKYGYK